MTDWFNSGPPLVEDSFSSTVEKSRTGAKVAETKMMTLYLSLSLQSSSLTEWWLHLKSWITTIHYSYPYALPFLALLFICHFSTKYCFTATQVCCLYLQWLQLIALLHCKCFFYIHIYSYVVSSIHPPHQIFYWVTRNLESPGEPWDSTHKSGSIQDRMPDYQGAQSHTFTLLVTI